jgi:carbamoyltransferase
VASDGRPLYAAAEERFTKKKLQKGFPRLALADLGDRHGTVERGACYVDLPLGRKIARNLDLILNSWAKGLNCDKSLGSLARTWLKRAENCQAHGVVGSDGFVGADANSFDALCEHHTAHAASAYYPSGFESAVVLTIDGVGDCLSGSLFDGEGGRLTLRKQFYYNELTVGADYETFTAMMGFDPDRHCGKITGLAAYGRHNPDCIAALEMFFSESWRRGQRNYFDRLHGDASEATLDELRRLRRSRFGAYTREDLAFAMQHLAEEGVLSLIREHVGEVRGRDIALAGGVFANVRINQKIKRLGCRRIFVQPAMDDGGLSLGAAWWRLGQVTTLRPFRLESMFLGPRFEDEDIKEKLDRAGVRFEKADNIAYAVAKLIAAGAVVGRFDGAMEFGPRALGNRSILCQASDPSINDWLNKRLRRTEFMPFAPATTVERAPRYYKGIEGCEHTAEFMTVTFDTTDELREKCPAVVHVDGTARAQFVRSDANPGLHEIISEYEKLTGVATILNTSFNMHESPIIATPEDAIHTFRDGRLDFLAIGPFLARAVDEPRRRVSTETTNRKSSPSHERSSLAGVGA